jgi:hypothetical protein
MQTIRTEMIPEMLVIFNQVTWLIARKDFINNILNIFSMECIRDPESNGKLNTIIFWNGTSYSLVRVY